ncbi:MAG: dihydrolipoyl dehydrogenase [Paludibacteraceae bacterium]|nr:dihydrolipoyl dehydrogenase [Paludibacteraceae bacterium]
MINLAIIGGGPAGYTAAEKASKSGMHVVLFEQDTLGGTCLNVGCIPTKTLLYSAKQYYNAKNATKYGVTAEGVQFDYAKIVQRKTKVVRKLVAGIKQKLNNEYCQVVKGFAQVLSRTDEQVVIRCGEETYEAENLLICTGSTNFVPPIPGVKDNPAVWDSTDALAATQLPQSMIIVGGGVIGMEFATLYHELGVHVTVIEAMPTILPNLDQEVVNILLDKYRKTGIQILTETKVTEVCENKVITTNGEYEAEHILISVGRRANLNGLEALDNLEMYRGGIVVDEMMRTNLKNVYAAGDVTGKMMLAHVASRQAEVAVGRMLKQLPLQRIAYNAIPSVVYTNPEIACVGLTEKDLNDIKEGDFAPSMNTDEPFVPYEVHKMPMTYSGRFVAENEGEMGLCKMIVDKKNKTILGVHMIGNPCSEFVAAASFAVRMGYTVHEFQQVVFPHPTVSEILKEVL